MGNFVNGSNNQDMKDFFWEKRYTAKIPNGMIEIGIQSNNTSCSYIIKNLLIPQRCKRA